MNFSVIIPTRNRPHLFKRALASVLAQSSAEFEVIVVDDGSDEVHADAYRALEAEAGPRVRFFHLRRIGLGRGHGSSYVLNFGAAEAQGAYLSFLDDDDEWIDAGHLARVATVISASTTPIDMHFANQQAVVNGEPVHKIIWIEDLPDRLGPSVRPDASGIYDLTARDLLKAHGFCHLNTTIVRRQFFADIGGLDESIRYEQDRDFYLRAIDRARVIKYCPRVVARHHVPDAARQSSESTSVSTLEKCMFQIRVLDKAILFAATAEIREYGRLHKTYVLKRMAEELARMGRFHSAVYYAFEALLIGFGAKWLGYSLVLWARARGRNT